MAHRRPPARGPGLSRRHHRPARLALGRAVPRAGPAEPVLRRHRRQHGLDGQPLHQRPQGPLATTPTRPAARPASGPTARSSSTPSAAARPSPTCRSSSAASRPACAASPTTTTGRTRSAARSCSTAKADLLLYGNAERAIVEIAHRLARRRAASASIRDVRGTAFVDPRAAGRLGARSTRPPSTGPARSTPPPDPYAHGRRSEPGRAVRHRRGAAPAPRPSCPLRLRRAPRADRATHRDPPARYEQVAATRCSTPTPRASSTSRPTPATPAPWCSATAIATCGSTRRRFR